MFTSVLVLAPGWIDADDAIARTVGGQKAFPGQSVLEESVTGVRLQ